MIHSYPPPVSGQTYSLANGYVNILGFIIMWGNTGVLPDSIFNNFSFPFGGFPTQAMGMIAMQCNNNGANNRPMAAFPISKTQFSIEATGSGANAFYIAIGF
jgi:hypothetical protein